MKNTTRLLLLSLALWGCDDGSEDGRSGADAAVADGAVADDLGTLGDAAEGVDPDGAADAAPEPDAAPEGFPAAPAPIYSEGECPELTPGRNTFRSAGLDRAVDLYIPRDPERARVLFMWHPLGSNAAQIATFLGARVASQQRELLIIVPESRRTQTEWGYAGNDAAPDLALFDDLLGCAAEQFDVDLDQVFTTGFSAGALWSTYLVMHRAQHLAGAVILSGGVAPFFSAYQTPEFALPTLVAWGGPNDTFRQFVNFEETSEALRDNLLDDGHFVVTCVHQGGHVPPPGVSEWGYDFIDAHDTRDPASPLAAGLTDSFPDICAIAE